MPARFADGAKSLVPPRVTPVGEEYGGIRKQHERRPRRTMWPDLAARGHTRVPCPLRAECRPLPIGATEPRLSG